MFATMPSLQSKPIKASLPLTIAILLAGSWHLLAAAEEVPEISPPVPAVAAADSVKRIYGWGYAKLPNQPVTQLTQVAAALAGFTVALQSDGSVVVWGGTANGEHLSPAGNDFTAVVKDNRPRFAGIVKRLMIPLSISARSFHSDLRGNVPLRETGFHHRRSRPERVGSGTKEG